MKQNIYQIIKLEKRARRRAQGSLAQLTKEPRKNPDAKPWKGNSGVNVNFHRNRLAVCASVITRISKELLKRRVGLSPARPNGNLNYTTPGA